MAATAPTPLSRGGLGGVLRPRDLVRAVTLLKKLFSWRGSREIETWRWIARKASRQEQSPRGADANPATWDAKSLSERNSNLKVAGSIFHQQGRDLGDSRVTPCVTSVIYLYVLGWPLAYTLFVLLGNGKTWSKRCKMWPRTVIEIKQIVIVTEQKTHPWFLQRQEKQKKKRKKKPKKWWSINLHDAKVGYKLQTPPCAPTSFHCTAELGGCWWDWCLWCIASKSGKEKELLVRFCFD